ncbi:MAG: methylated-DNA--[protein]-cysteine S-methyltransferase [Bacillaceae bacterium]|nr:methylated-DNA--[protein]-cysteine S-methyltransferase [Bacillaceae bacterium]
MSRDLTVKYGEMDSPIGPITIASTPRGICQIRFGNSDSQKFSLLRWCQKWINSDFQADHLQRDDDAHREVVEQLESYFAGERWEFTVPLDIRGTSFQKMVWSELLQIPYGETRSYKDIAVNMGAPKAVRAIGGANNKNPLPILIPCHRVVGSNGAMVGYGGGIHIKEFLLELERKQILAEQAR